MPERRSCLGQSLSAPPLKSTDGPDPPPIPHPAAHPATRGHFNPSTLKQPANGVARVGGAITGLSGPPVGQQG